MSEKLNYNQLMALIQEGIARTEKQVEADRVRAEKDRVRAEESRARTDKAMQELGEYIRETDRTLKAAMLELRETMAESAAETDRVVKAVSQQLGGIGNSNGAMAEDYFFNSLDKSKMLGNEKFDYADRNVKFGIKDLRDEYDIVLYNCESVSIVEVKYSAEQKHIAQTDLPYVWRTGGVASRVFQGECSCPVPFQSPNRWRSRCQSQTRSPNRRRKRTRRSSGKMPSTS